MNCDRAGRTAWIGRQRAGLAERRADEALQESCGLGGIELVGSAGHHRLRASGRTVPGNAGRRTMRRRSRGGHLGGGRLEACCASRFMRCPLVA